jgi:hypothetical protein
MLFWTDNRLMLLFRTWSIKVDIVILDMVYYGGCYFGQIIG